MTDKRIELSDNEIDKVVGGVGHRSNQEAGKPGVKVGIVDMPGGIKNGTDNTSNSIKNAVDQVTSLQQPNS